LAHRWRIRSPPTVKDAEGCLGFSRRRRGGGSSRRRGGCGNGGSPSLRLGLRGGRLRTIVCDVTGASAAEAKLVVHAALAFFGLELAVGAEDVRNAGSLTPGVGGVGRTGRGLLLVLFDCCC
jgi:hypothetical protein